MSALLLLSISGLFGAGSCRQWLSGVCSKLVSQSESLIEICTAGNALGRVPVDSLVCV